MDNITIVLHEKNKQFLELKKTRLNLKKSKCNIRSFKFYQSTTKN